jgi:predicted ATPase/transcriptional regulator with GAF, ATPase, and Fis domain
MIPGYEVSETLRHGDGQTLVRAQRCTDRQQVLLKISSREPASSADLADLAREASLLDGLEVMGVPRCVDLVRQPTRVALVLTDPGGLPLSRWLESGPLGVEASLRIALGLSAILVELHRREIVHRHLQPGSILTQADDWQPMLVDLHLASRSSSEAAVPVPLDRLREGLAYISPEQTGRLNRTADYRADLYSLGVILYELLTGCLPHRSSDALELIHCHIARVPRSPSEVDSAIPLPISELVMRLLAKAPDERYQCAAGVRADLQHCLDEWRSRQQVAPFELAQQDVSDRFLIPQRLYGRQAEAATLLAAFQRACEGQSSLLLAEGHSGVGKTSLILELGRPIVRERGYFLSGKFDQVVPSVPFGALLQAFRGLVRQLLCESPERLRDWRARILEVLGPNAAVLSEVLPELTWIIGKQAAPISLGPTESLNRFHLVLETFLATLARPEHPVVLFLDDLQWADAATLSVLGLLLTSPDIHCLLLIGAYRENEIHAGHPLPKTLSDIRAAGGNVQALRVGLLALGDVTELVADALHTDHSDAQPLARLVLAKTNGNPLFATQFLRTLKDEGWIDFDYSERRWRYRLSEIESAVMTDNVVDLMTRKLARLSERTQRALTLAACIGNSFDAETLGVVSNQSPAHALRDLDEAIRQGLIVAASSSHELRASENACTEASYAFSHDRVQQLAYSLIPSEQRAVVHLQVGRLLWRQAEADRTDDRLFDVTHHLNVGSALLNDAGERLALARLNWKAGLKAKSATAHAAALAYFQAGAALLTAESWHTEYQLVFELAIEAAEAQYRCGHFEEAKRQLDRLLGRAQTNLDRARVYNIEMIQHENLSRYADALNVARQSMRLFGVEFLDAVETRDAALQVELETIEELLAGREIASLIDLPVMSDVETRMVMNILTDIWSPAYILGDATLARLISATMVRLSLVHGNLEESAYGYVTHAISVGPVRGDHRSAYEFGRLALAVNERFADSRRRAKIHQQFHAHVNLWRQPFATCLPYAREACRSGLESGDFVYASYGAATETWPALACTRDLAEFVRDYTPNLALTRRLKVTAFSDALLLMLNWARALRGQTEAPLSLSAAGLDEREYVETYRDNPFFSLFHQVARLQVSYLLGAEEQALAAAERAHELRQHLAGTIWPVWVDFWGGLALAQSHASFEHEAWQTRRARLASAHASLVLLAENCPENFRCLALLLGAEVDRIDGREANSLTACEHAVRYARDTGQLQYEALGLELSGRLCLRQAKAQPGAATERAASFLSQARQAYHRWGASAKVRALDQRYHQLWANQGHEPYPRSRPLPLPLPPPGAAGALLAPEPQATDANALDLFSVMKAAQAIARETELEALLVTLMRLVIENAGAERGSLVIEQHGELFVQAKGSVDGAEVQVHDGLPLRRARDLAESVVHYVCRTHEPVVTNDARSDERWAADPHVRSCAVRSLMCLPVLQPVAAQHSTGNTLSAALYLENNLVSAAFTPDRILVCQMLASHAAIALSNARSFGAMREEVLLRRHAEQTLRSVTEGTAAVTGSDFFASLVRHLSAALEVPYALVTKCDPSNAVHAQTLAFWKRELLAENFSYELAHTPFAAIIEGAACHYPAQVQRFFPRDELLVELGVESFLGLPLLDARGQVIGHLAALDTRPMPAPPRGLSLLQIFAARAGAELERQRSEEHRLRALQEVERLRQRLEAENVYLQEEIRADHNFEEIVGNGPALLEALGLVARVAPTDSTVLIQGETGTGKELIARAIHGRSKRRDRPLVKVNCGAISSGLVESELFGHVRGAFTGATERRLGRFELAHGGTLFLDEVGELTLDTQVKLLRVLQEGEFEPVGSNKTLHVDVRIIAATNRKLDRAVSEGRFRSDLFYRLNVLPIEVPPLRDRRSDIPLLAQFFLRRFARQFGKAIEELSPASMTQLLAYDWPGNIRELQNVMERAVVLSSGKLLQLDRDLRPVAATAATSDAPAPSRAGSSVLAATTSASGPLPPAAASLASSVAKPGTASDALEEVQRRHILAVLERTRGVVEGPNGAAQLLGLHPNTLRSRLKRLGLR